MKAYVERLNFGKMYPTQESIDNFWLLGPSKISPFAQIDFLKMLILGQNTFKFRFFNILFFCFELFKKYSF